MPKTRYVVLEEISTQDGPEYWSVYDVGVEATSATGALRAALKGQGDLGVHYVAVPQRSWNPQTVQVETQHRLKIG